MPGLTQNVHTCWLMMWSQRVVRLRRVLKPLKAKHQLLPLMPLHLHVDSVGVNLTESGAMLHRYIGREWFRRRLK